MEQSCWDHNPAVSLSNHFSVDMPSLYFNALLKTVHPSKSHFSDLQWCNSGPCCSDVQVDLAFQLWNAAVMLFVARCETGVKTVTQHFTPVLAYFHTSNMSMAAQINHTNIRPALRFEYCHGAGSGLCNTLRVRFCFWFLIPLFNIYILLSSLQVSVLLCFQCYIGVLLCSQTRLHVYLPLFPPICSSVPSLFPCSHSQFLVLPVLSVRRPACIILCVYCLRLILFVLTMSLIPAWVLCLTAYVL